VLFFQKEKHPVNENRLTHILVRGLHLFVIAALLAGMVLVVLAVWLVAHAATIRESRHTGV